MSAGLQIVVADERSSAEETAVLIQRWGHRVKQVHDGLAAVNEAQAQKPDLMLIGLSLPGLNGLGVVQRVRELPDFGRTKLVALLNAPGDLPTRILKKAGFSETLVKPVVPLELLTSIVKTREAIARWHALAGNTRGEADLWESCARRL